MADLEDRQDFDALPSFAPVRPRPEPPPTPPPQAPAREPPSRPAWRPEQPVRRRRRSALLGVLVVALCLALGFLGGRMIARHAAEPPEEPAAAVPLPPAADSPAAARVVIHYATTSDAARQAALALAGALSRAGYGTIEIRSETAAADGDRIRYFDAGKRAAAAALARSAGDVLRRFGRGAPRLEDAAGAASKPPPGTLEIWLGAA